MSILTSVLKLFKYDLAKDQKSTFNFTLSLNDNWDKIDAWAKEKNDNENKIKASIPTLLSQLTNDMGFLNSANVAANSFYSNVTVNGTSCTVEFFNDAAKSSRVFMIQMGQVVGFNTCKFPKTFNTVFGVFGQVITTETCVSAAIQNVTTSSFYITDGTHGGRHEDRGGLTNYWIAFGK